MVKATEDREPDAWETHTKDIRTDHTFAALRDLVAADMERLVNRVGVPCRIEVQISVYSLEEEAATDSDGEEVEDE